MKSNISFWYPVTSDEQMTFDGTVVHKDVIAGEGHITYMEVLLCRQSREKLKHEAKAKKHKNVSARVEGIKVCPKCIAKFKEHPDLAWAHWISPPEPKKSATVQINPEILQRSLLDSERQDG